FILPPKIGSVGGQALILGNRLNSSGQEGRKGLDEQFRPQAAQLVVETSRVIPFTDGNRPLRQDVSGIQGGHHFHDGDPRLFLPVDRRPVNRRSPAVFGKQGRVHVDAAVARAIQNLPGDDLTVGGRHHQIRIHGENGSNRLRVAQLLRLKHGN